MALVNIDSRVSEKIYVKGGVIKTVADALTISGDELVLIGFPATLGSVIFTARGFGISAYSTMSCLEEACWDAFGAAALCCMVETILKTIVRRERPGYAKQRTHYALVGERYSFPSGHTLRCFYWMFYAHSIARKFNFGWLSSLPLLTIFCWASAVGWSRVALGRHYVLDVVAGAVCGMVLSFLVETQFAVSVRAVLFIVTGILLTFEWGAVCVLRQLCSCLSNSQKACVGVMYYGFYGTLLVSTVASRQWDLEPSWVGHCSA